MPHNIRICAGKTYPLNATFRGKLLDDGQRDLLLVHHGVPSNLEKGKVTLGPSYLSRQGMESIRQIAIQLSKECPELNVIITAVDKCSIQSATILGSFLGSPHIYPREDGALQQKIIPPQANGRYLSEIMATNPDLYKHIIEPHNAPEVSFSGGESYNSFYARSSGALHDIVENLPSGSIEALVGHGSWFGVALCELLGRKQDEVGHTEYGTLTWLKITKAGEEPNVFIKYLSEAFGGGTRG